MNNAEHYHAPNIKGVREKTGSTDFGNVTYVIPGACLRIAFVDDGVSSHSQEFLDNGKTQLAHDALITSAKIIAATAADLIASPERVIAIQQDFQKTKDQLKKESQS